MGQALEKEIEDDGVLMQGGIGPPGINGEQLEVARLDRRRQPGHTVPVAGGGQAVHLADPLRQGVGRQPGMELRWHNLDAELLQLTLEWIESLAGQRRLRARHHAGHGHRQREAGIQHGAPEPAHMARALAGVEALACGDVSVHHLAAQPSAEQRIDLHLRAKRRQIPLDRLVRPDRGRAQRALEQAHRSASADR